MRSTAVPRLARRLRRAATIACLLLGASNTALANGRCPPCPSDACQNDPAVWPAIRARKAQLCERGFPERLLPIVEKLPRCLRCVRGPDQIDTFQLVEVGLDGKPAHAPTDWSATAERLEHAFEANAARAKALAEELAAADAALGTCQERRCRPAPAATPRPPEAPRASVNLHVGPSLDLGLITYSQLAFRVSALLRVLPHGLPGFLVFAPTLSVLGGSITLQLPLGLQYEYLLPWIPISVYARFSLGYAAQFIGSGPLVLERSSALLLPEGGVLYRFARLPLQVGADLLSVAILVNRAYTAGSYQILCYAGWTFGR